MQYLFKKSLGYAAPWNSLSVGNIHFNPTEVMTVKIEQKTQHPEGQRSKHCLFESMQLLSVMICYPVFVTYSESALDMVVLSF
jgi:hypothetical protein